MFLRTICVAKHIYGCPELYELQQFPASFTGFSSDGDV